jgi:hypothetical protein
MTSLQVGKPPLLMRRISTFSPQLAHVAHLPPFFQLCLWPLSLGMFSSHLPICACIPRFNLQELLDDFKLCMLQINSHEDHIQSLNVK